MKFANYKYNARGVNNLGDNMQIIAIDYIYETMKVPKNEIIYIDVHDLKTYNGEYVVLPVTMPLIDYQERGIAGRFSDRIIPVFLGLTLVKDSLDECEIDYYKRFEPIGCRDERTLLTMRRYGINSYLHGCITITFPRRNINEQSDVFIVDVDEQFLPFIPDYLKKNAKYRTHFIKEHLDNPKERTLEQYNEYLNNAKVVITSRLHCAIPCLAAGIPVVLLKSMVSYRFSWVEKVLPIYTLDDIDLINWNPNNTLSENHKQKVLELTKERILSTFTKYQDLLEVSFFYETRNKKDYVVDACYSLIKFIETNWIDKKMTGTFAFWGLTQMSEYLYDYIISNFPNMKLSHVYDSFRKIKFKGIEAIQPDNISNYPYEYVFVTASGVINAAQDLFVRIKKPEGTFCYLKVIK